MGFELSVIESVDMLMRIRRRHHYRRGSSFTLESFIIVIIALVLMLIVNIMEKKAKENGTEGSFKTIKSVIMGIALVLIILSSFFDDNKDTN